VMARSSQWWPDETTSQWPGVEELSDSKDVTKEAEESTMLGAVARQPLENKLKKLNSVACSPQANYTDRAAAAC
jgi:hypothetical protein